MNKNIAKPLIIQFTPPEANPVLKKSAKSLFVPVNAPWNQFRDNVLPLVSSGDYDSVLVHTRDEVDRDMKGVVGNMSIKLNALAGAGTRVGKPVLSYEATDKPFYLANPTKDDMKAADVYAPSDETIMGKYNGYESDGAWQKHQSDIWNRMKDMMPLSRKTDQFNRDHAAQLKDPKRGLEEKDLGKFWSFKARQGLSPTVMGDDMVGMPSVEGREYRGFVMSIARPDGKVEQKPMQVRSLMTAGANGIAIPMANADGDVNKHQIATDLTPYGTALHFRAEDGRTVAKGELFDRKTREYSFKFTDGTDTHLKASAVSQENVITLQDAHGIFNVKPKQEIVDVLRDRGYEVPDIIKSVKPEQNGKYMWQSPGTMTGSEEVLKTVSPSNPGFIKAREPKNGRDDYVVLVAEGALKGHIVAKYVDVKDKNGVCFGDRIAGDKGIIVTQVPGVAEAYVKNATPIYEKYKVAGTYIAMDADGRENRNVAKGIHSAYNYINKTNPTTVLSWDPAQKGMDDALLAVAQGKITIDDMKLVSGKPEALFPIDKAHAMTPYKLDGTQTNSPSWVQEYEEDKKARQEKVAAAQAATAERNADKMAEAVQNAGPVDIAPIQSGQWMETPKDISNIQAVTVSKAAEMADAMAGKLPERKPDPKAVHTPDVDEAPSMQDNDAPRRDNPALAWSNANPEMPAVDIPAQCKSTYLYQQPVLAATDPTVGHPDLKYTEHEKGKWGVVDFVASRIMTQTGQENIQNALKQNGAQCIGNMRLTSQTITLDDNYGLELSADDMQRLDDKDDGLGR